MKRRYVFALSLGLVGFVAAGGIGVAFETQIQSIATSTSILDQETAANEAQVRACATNYRSEQRTASQLTQLAVLRDYDDAQRTLESTIRSIVDSEKITFQRIDPGWVPPRGSQVATSGAFTMASPPPAARAIPPPQPTPIATQGPSIFATPAAALAATPLLRPAGGIDAIPGLTPNKVTFTFSGTPSQIVAASARLAQTRTVIRVNSISFFHDDANPQQSASVVGAIYTTVYLPKTIGAEPPINVTCPKPVIAAFPPVSR